MSGAGGCGTRVRPLARLRLAGIAPEATRVIVKRLALEAAAIGESFFAEPGLACPEAVALEAVRSTTVGGNAVGTSFDNGRFTVTGVHIDEVTNIATGKSVINKLQGRVV